MKQRVEARFWEMKGNMQLYMLISPQVLFNELYQVLPALLVPRLHFDVDGSPLFLPFINFITLSPTPLHLTKR